MITKIQARFNQNRINFQNQKKQLTKSRNNSISFGEGLSHFCIDPKKSAIMNETTKKLLEKAAKNLAEKKQKVLESFSTLVNKFVQENEKALKMKIDLPTNPRESDTLMSLTSKEPVDGIDVTFFDMTNKGSNRFSDYTISQVKDNTFHSSIFIKDNEISVFNEKHQEEDLNESVQKCLKSVL